MFPRNGFFQLKRNTLGPRIFYRNDGKRRDAYVRVNGPFRRDSRIRICAGEKAIQSRIVLLEFPAVFTM